MNENKTTKEKFLIIGGIILFVFIAISQVIINKNGIGNKMSGINGTLLQIQVLDSVLLTVLCRKSGLITAIVLNAVNCFCTLVFVILIAKNFGSLPTIVSTFITIITCCIIYTYSDRVQKSTDELKEKNNELTETNRVIREKDEKLIYLAYYDVLTGLANRQLFIEQIDELINNNPDEQFTVIIADIDEFKRIIDTYGHNTGDVMLSTYADRLRAYCGQNDFVAKFGEEEYAIIVRKPSDDSETIEYINKLRSALCAPIVVNDVPLQLTMSFGVAEFPANGRNSSEILRNTDIAVTNAKMTGRGCIFFLNQNKFM